MFTGFKDFGEINKEHRLLVTSIGTRAELLEKVSTMPKIQQVALEGYFKGYTSIEVARALGAVREDVEDALRDAYEELDTVGMLERFQCLIRNNETLTIPEY